MIILKLWGGMCNQMFQLAFGYALSKMHNEDLFVDLSFYKNQPKHVGHRKPMSVENFPNISCVSNVADRSSIVALFENRYLNALIRRTSGLNVCLGSNHVVIEKLHRYYDVIPYIQDKINYYDGYWMSKDYFESQRQNIITLFRPNDIIVEKVNNWRQSVDSSSCVAIHVRRGDYLNNRNSNELQNIEYYMEAIELMKSKVDNPVFFFFSDDLEWCRENFSHLENTFFVENRCKNGDIIDLFSIAACNHGIMSNSTFSWWANWLRPQSKDSVVICSSSIKINNHYIPSNWIEI